MEMTPQLQQFIQLLSGLYSPHEYAIPAAKLAFGKTITLREERMSPGMCKHHIIGLEFDAVLHHFTVPDTGDPHDHPWNFTTYILQGSYIEQVYNLNYRGVYEETYRTVGTSHHVNSHIIHKVGHLPDGECWTLVLPEYKEGGTTHFYRYENGWQRRQWNESEWREMR